jgi:hypothetical protein
MIIQRVLRGVAGIDQTQAQQMLNDGIFCNLCRNKGRLVIQILHRSLWTETPSGTRTIIEIPIHSIRIV